MKNYYSKIRELEKELERNKKIYSKLCRQRENLNDRKGVVMLTECMDLEMLHKNFCNCNMIMRLIF